MTDDVTRRSFLKATAGLAAAAPLAADAPDTDQTSDPPDDTIVFDREVLEQVSKRTEPEPDLDRLWRHDVTMRPAPTMAKLVDLEGD